MALFSASWLKQHTFQTCFPPRVGWSSLSAGQLQGYRRRVLIKAHIVVLYLDPEHKYEEHLITQGSLNSRLSAQAIQTEVQTLPIHLQPLEQHEGRLSMAFALYY